MTMPTLQFYAGNSGQTIHAAASSILTAFNTEAEQALNVRAGGGTYTLSFGGHTTTTLKPGAPASAVQAAMQALASVGSGNFTVAGERPCQGMFAGTLAGIPQAAITINAGSLATAGTAAPTTAGTTAEAVTDTTSGTFAKIGSAWVNNPAVTNSFKVIAGGSGLNQAEWSIPVTATGNYQVFLAACGVSGSTLAPSVPVCFFDGDTYRGKVTVNQQLQANPVQFADGSSESFQAIATVYATSGNALRILITDEVAGGDIGKLVVVSRIAVVPVDPTFAVRTAQLDAPSCVTETGSWSSQISNSLCWNNFQHYTASPSATLTTDFPGLIPGCTYSVQIQYLLNVNGSTLTSFQVSDSGSNLGSPVVVNQTLAGSGGVTKSDNNSNSFAFKNLGNFTTTSGNLRVVMHAGSDCNGTIVSVINAIALNLVTVAAPSETVATATTVIANGPPQITINGGSPVTLSANPIWDKLLTVNGLGLPNMAFVLDPSTPIAQGDAVAITYQSGTFTTVAGPIAAATNATVSNRVGSRCQPATPANRTLNAGWNILSPDSDIGMFSNWAWNTTAVDYNGADSPTPAQTTDLYPQYTHYDRWSLQIPALTGPNQIDARGYPRYPATGTTTIFYDGGVGGCILGTPGAGTTSAFVSTNTGHVQNNQIKINWTLDGPNATYSPAYQLQLYGLRDITDDSDSGRWTYTGGTWTTPASASAWNGGYHKSSGAAPDKATITFGSLPAATYTPAASWVANAGNTTAMTMVVKESGVAVDATSRTFNQRSAASGVALTDWNGHAINFTPAASFITAGGPITIELTGAGDGFLIADGIDLLCSSTLGSPYAPWTNIRVYDSEIDLTPVSGTLTSGSAVVTGLASTTGLLPGYAVFGTGLPSYTEILSVDSGTQITLTANATASGSKSLILIPEFHPTFLARLGPAKVLRSMQLLGGITGAQIDYADYGTATQLSYGQAARRNHYAVTKVDDYTNPNGWFDSDKKSALFTVTPINGATLPFVSGQPVFLEFLCLLDLVGGGQIDLSFDDENIEAVGSNQFAMATQGDRTKTIVTKTTGLGNCVAQFTAIYPPRWFRLCKAVGARPWTNLAVVISNACAVAWANAYMAAYPVGSWFLVEVGNEPWNFLLQGYGAWFGIGNTSSPPIPQMAGYAKGATRIFDAIATAMGARAGELVRILNGQAGDAGRIVEAFTWINNNHKTCQLVVCATYHDIQPQSISGAAYDTLYASLTAPVLADLNDACMAFDGLTQTFLSNYQAESIAQTAAQSGATPANTTCNFGLYEGGIVTFSAGGTTLELRRQTSACYDPLAYEAQLGLLALQQSYGVTDFCNYSFDSEPFRESLYDHYGVYVGSYAAAGLGTSTNPSQISGAPPAVPDLRVVETPIGQAMNDWNTNSATTPIYDRINGNGTNGVDVSASGYVDSLLSGGSHYTVGTLRTGGHAVLSSTTPQRIRAADTSGTCMVAPASIVSADCRVEMLVYYADLTAQQVMAVGRTDATGWTVGYSVMHLNGQLYMTHDPASGGSVVGSGSPVTFTVTAASTHHYALEMVGSEISAYGDGVSLMSAADTGTTAAGYAGFGFFGGSPDNTHGPQIVRWATLNVGGTPTIAAPTASTPSGGAATLSWLPVDGGTGPGEYQLQRSATGTGGWSNVGSATFDWQAVDSGQSGTRFYRVVATQPGAVVTNSGNASVVYGGATATTYTLTPPSPSTGQPGVASATFGVQLDAIPSSPVTITPAAATGTFTPATLLVNDANVHTFTYAAASVGSKTISATNNGGLTDPPPVTFTAYSLALAPSSQSVALSTAASLTATLTGGSGSLAATTTGGTLSTASPTSGTPFTLTTQAIGFGTDTVTVTGPGGTSASATVSFPTGNEPDSGPHWVWYQQHYLTARERYAARLSR